MRSIKLQSNTRGRVSEDLTPLPVLCRRGVADPVGLCLSAVLLRFLKNSLRTRAAPGIQIQHFGDESPETDGVLIQQGDLVVVTRPFKDFTQIREEMGADVTMK